MSSIHNGPFDPDNIDGLKRLYEKANHAVALAIEGGEEYLSHEDVCALVDAWMSTWQFGYPRDVGFDRPSR